MVVSGFRLSRLVLTTEFHASLGVEFDVNHFSIAHARLTAKATFGFFEGQ